MMYCESLLILLICLQQASGGFYTTSSILRRLKGSDTTLNAAEIITTRGFIAEWYPLESYDGTPLSIHHIINPLADPMTLNEHPVLILNGFTGDATQMLAHSHNVTARRPIVGVPTFNKTDENLPFALANNNFDVWLMDPRGSNLHNPAAREMHKKLRSKFWNFTIDDQLMNDVPAAINFVLSQTQTNMLSYIGYSESTFFMFGLLSLYPELSNRIVSFTAMAPVAYVSHVKGIMIPLGAPYILLPDTFDGDFSPLGAQRVTSNLFDMVCRFKMLRTTFCRKFITSIGGHGSSDYETDFYGAIFKGASIKTIKQVVQLFLDDRFGMYDYGKEGNFRQYGQEDPPSYDLRKINLTRIILVRGGQDYLSDPKDQKKLLHHLRVKPYHDIVIPEYNHWDFLMGNNLAEKVNIPVIKTIYEILNNLGNGQVQIRNRIPQKVADPRAIFTSKVAAALNISESGQARYITEKEPSWPKNGKPLPGPVSPIKTLESAGETARDLGDSLVRTAKKIVKP